MKSILLLAFSLIFWSIVERFLSNCPASDLTFFLFNSLFSLNVWNLSTKKETTDWDKKNPKKEPTFDAIPTWISRNNNKCAQNSKKINLKNYTLHFVRAPITKLKRVDKTGYVIGNCWIYKTSTSHKKSATNRIELDYYWAEGVIGSSQHFYYRGDLIPITHQIIIYMFIFQP